MNRFRGYSFTELNELATAEIYINNDILDQQVYAVGEEYYAEVKEIGSWQLYQAMTNMAHASFNYTLDKTSARCRHSKPRVRIWKHCVLQSFSSVQLLLLLLLLFGSIFLFVVAFLLFLVCCFVVVVLCFCCLFFVVVVLLLFCVDIRCLAVN